MNEFEFARQYLESYTVVGDEIKPVYCPLCHGGSHKDTNTFALNYKKHTYNCLRGSCGGAGHFSQLCKEFGVDADKGDEFYAPPVRRTYKQPDVKIEPKTNKVRKYLSLRGITDETLDAFKIGSKDGNIVFPFFKPGESEASFIKYRKPEKVTKGNGPKMWREKDAEPILFGMHLCDTTNPLLYIFEGEIDCMCGWQVSKLNCVSVPSGCEDFTWLETCYDWLKNFTAVAVIADNDDAGLKMLREISNKFDCAILRTNFELYKGCKDANEILFKHGEDQLKTVMAQIQPVDVQGLLNLADIENVDISELPRALTGIKSLDYSTGGSLMGDLTVWTGKRGEGKSTILTQIALNALDQGVNVCAYSGEIPDNRFKYIVNLQAAGSGFVKGKIDSKTDREVNYVSRSELEKIEAWYNGQFWLYDNRIIEADETESLLRLFTLAYKRYNCKLFIVDNLMTVATCRNDADYYQIQADFTIKLRKFSERYGVHVHLVVQPRKTNVIKDSDDVGGLSVITNIACNVFSMRRNDDTELDCNAVLSCHKNRMNGENMAIKMNYNPRTRRFTELGEAEHVYSWAESEFVPVSDPGMPF